MKLVLIVLVAGVALLILVEVFLRLLLGFGNPLLYLPDAEIGYLLAPNQKVRRFGNRIQINQYSMRSGTVSLQRSDSALRVLMIGDSIVNGGWWTDQKDILSELVAQQLSNAQKVETREDKARPTIEVLNASANSWGPRNELAYLKRFGLFASQVVVLVINTDDLFATAPTSLPVGHDRNYPDRKPALALGEVISRYLLPAPPVSEALKAVYAEGGDRVGVNLEAIVAIHQFVKQADAQLLLVLTPLLREVSPLEPRDYELKARQRLQALTTSEQIPFIDFLPIFNAAATQPKNLYQDHIHLSQSGNTLVSEKISKTILGFRF